MPRQPLIQSSRSTSVRATSSVALASIVLGSTALFIRPLSDAGIAPASLAFFRYAITALLLLPALDRRVGMRSATAWGIAGGGVSGLGWIAYAHALQTVDLAVNGVAYMTYPVFTMLAGWLVFQRRPAARSLGGGMLVLTAAAIALGPTSLLAVSPALFIAPATFGFSIAILTERLGVLDPFARLSAVALGASLALSPVVLSLPVEKVLPVEWSTWGLLLVVAIGCGLVPMWIYGAAAPLIGSARSAVSGAAELPTMFAIGVFAFGESLEPGHVIAAGLILGSIVLTPSKGQTAITPQDAIASSGAIRLARHAGQAAAITPEAAAAKAMTSNDVVGSTSVIWPSASAENVA